MLEQWNDGARLALVAAQRLRHERHEHLGVDHVVHGLLVTRCGAQQVLGQLGLQGVLGPAEGPGREPPRLLVDERRFIGSLDREARVEATVHRHPLITSCHIGIAAVMLASSTVEGGAGANRLRLALSRAGTNDEEAIGALRAHLTVAIAELVAGAQAGDAID